MKSIQNILSVFIWSTTLFLMGCNNDDNYSLIGPTTDIVFDSATANGSDQERTTSLTLTFDQEIEGLSLSDIFLTTGQTGTIASGITPQGGGIYDLTVRRIYNIGEIAVTVAKEGYLFTPPLQWVTVYGSTIPVQWEELTGNGSSDEPTTMLTLTFNGDIAEELSAEEITFKKGDGTDTDEDQGTGSTTIAEKGELTYRGNGTFDLSLLNVTEEGDLNVGIEKYGYEFTPASKTVHLYPWTKIEWSSLSANGSETETTTKLSFIFSANIDGLTSEDITIDAGKTGAVKGELKQLITGVYELPLDSITQSGAISVSIFKTGYAINPEEKDVDIFYAETDTDEEVVE
ncbi:MAG TPA: hypothetical protein H9779_06850 [Candidatus Alistipes avicola]|uniref:Uncharacterized protein n=1 Tax=Candidatus Alistipes avicola TaxID=2838432 RepID=A0A9D2L4T9_9BACT|nr:hypothetical protein [uncultured Alistipes sp.]HJA99295.1 hypothetical protein [Candidatus Alistipes avicola]